MDAQERFRGNPATNHHVILKWVYHPFTLQTIQTKFQWVTRTMFTRDSSLRDFRSFSGNVTKLDSKQIQGQHISSNNRPLDINAQFGINKTCTHCMATSSLLGIMSSAISTMPEYYLTRDTGNFDFTTKIPSIYSWLEPFSQIYRAVIHQTVDVSNKYSHCVYAISNPSRSCLFSFANNTMRLLICHHFGKVTSRSSGRQVVSIKSRDTVQITDGVNASDDRSWWHWANSHEDSSNCIRISYWNSEWPDKRWYRTHGVLGWGDRYSLDLKRFLSLRFVGDLDGVHS